MATPKFCPKCGEELVSVRLPNEEPQYKMSYLTLHPMRITGDKYSRKNGKRFSR